MKYFFLAFKKWNDINGRANLKEFWYFVLFSFIFSILIGLVEILYYDIPADEIEDFSGGILSLIYSILLFIPNITLTIRRLHDVNKSGWNLLWSLTIIGILYVLFLNILKGSKGDNDYGSPSDNQPDYKNMNEDDKQKEDEVYNQINELVNRAKSEVDEEDLNENNLNKKNKSESFENNSNENNNYVKDTLTGEILKVNKEDYKKVVENYVDHTKNPALYRMPGLTGLQVYLKDRPNIKRIFEGLISYVDDGTSVREYLEKADLLNNEDSWIISGALLDISKFFKNILDKKEIPLIRKDYNTCIEAIKIFEEDGDIFNRTVWTDEELAVFYSLLCEIEWADGEMNKSPGFKYFVGNTITSLINNNMEEAMKADDSEKIMQIQALAENLYSPDQKHSIAIDYNRLSIPKKHHISHSVSFLLYENNHPKKVEMAQYFGVPFLNQEEFRDFLASTKKK